jgi:hypothetical protein
MGRQKTYLYPWFGALALAVLTAVLGFALSHKSKVLAPNAQPSASVLTAASVFSVTPSHQELQHLIDTLVQESAQPKKNLETDKAVQALVTKLTGPDYQQLREKVLNPNANMSEREAALYILTLSPTVQAEKALVQLVESALPEFKGLNDPHSAGSTQRTLEMGLRVTAIESLDQRALGSPEVVKDLHQILQRQSEPSLRFLVQTSLSGIESGKPGRLKRIIDEMLGSAK